MKNIISFDLAVKLCLGIFGLVILFHLSIIVGMLLFDFAPVEYLWGGKMETAEELLGFEFISLIVMLVCFFVVMIRSGKIDKPSLLKTSNIIIWILFVLFLLNTAGNLLAKTTFEKMFGIVTVILAFLCLRIALEKIDKP